jgi:hypothetical protein
MTRLSFTLIGFAVAGLLTACGGGSGGGQTSDSQQFVEAVKQVASRTSDDTEAEDVSGVKVGVDDGAEPQPLL